MLPMTIYGNVLVNDECTDDSHHILATLKSHAAFTDATEEVKVHGKQ